MHRFTVGRDPWGQYVVVDVRRVDGALATYTAYWAAALHALALNLAALLGVVAD